MRLKDADKLIEMIDDDIAVLDKIDMSREGYDVCLCTLKMVKQYINALPTVEAEPVKHGRNIATEYDDVDEFICSECGLHLENWVSVEVDEDTGEKTYHEFRLRRCPNCGARMIDEVEK